MSNQPDSRVLLYVFRRAVGYRRQKKWVEMSPLLQFCLSRILMLISERILRSNQNYHSGSKEDGQRARHDFTRQRSFKANLNFTALLDLTEGVSLLPPNCTLAKDLTVLRYDAVMLSVFWALAPCSPSEVDRTSYLALTRLQGARSQKCHLHTYRHENLKYHV
jgi:hypothetical protein